LQEGGNTVYCVDNLITGSMNNVRHLSGKRGFEYFEKDICGNDVVELFKSKKIDRIYNMASPASPVDYMEHPIETLMVGSIGAKNLLDIAKAHKARILISSTSEIYGDPLQHPQKEEYWGNVNSIGPRSCYDEAKRFMEAITMAYNRKYEVEVRIARIFNTYGPRMRMNDGRVVPNFITQALRGEDITIYGDGKQTRSFCFVDDQVNGLTKLMESEHTGPINIGNPDEKTVLEFAQTIISVTGSKSKVSFHPALTDDPKQRKPDITRARNLLNWDPRVSLKDGLHKTVDYFKSVIHV
jgi:dTDP-glucose 4,6-dehydratase